MGRKTDRIAALEHEVAALRRRASGDRHAMEAALDLLDEPYSWEAGGRAADVLRDRLVRLDLDPRPDSDDGQLHWLHVKDGDRLVWRLAAELIALHDAEATRLGQPTMKHRRPPIVDVRCPDCGRRRSDALMRGGGFDRHGDTIRPCPAEESP